MRIVDDDVGPKKNLGGGRGPLALGLMFIRGGQRSSSVASGFGILLLGGGLSCPSAAPCRWVAPLLAAG